MTGSTGSGRTLTVHQGVTFRPFKAIPGPPLPDRERRPITRPHGAKIHVRTRKFNEPNFRPLAGERHSLPEERKQRKKGQEFSR